MTYTVAPFSVETYPEQSVGRLMEPPVAVFFPNMTVGEATDIVRDLAASTRVFTYGHVVDATGVLVGVLTMRDLLLHEKKDTLDSFMLPRCRSRCRPDTPLMWTRCARR